MGWLAFKHWLQMSGGISMDAMHVLAGVLVQLLIAVLLRRSLRSPLPWLAVLLLALANEAVDLHVDKTWPDRGVQWVESIKDMLITMLLPSLLLMIARWAPGLL